MSEKKGLFGRIFGKKETPQAHDNDGVETDLTPELTDVPVNEGPINEPSNEKSNVSQSGDEEGALNPTSIAEVTDKAGLLARLREGLSRTSTKLTEGVSGIFTKRKLDDQTMEELEDLLISADLGVPAATKITAALAKD
ncbi:MAG: signal recognition particle receptor subunit alpha, partial [Parvularculaceae bacterium]